MTDFAKEVDASVSWDENTRIATVTRNGRNFQYSVVNGHVYLGINKVGYIYRDKIYLDDLVFFHNTGGDTVLEQGYKDAMGRILTKEGYEESERIAQNAMDMAIGSSMAGSIKNVGGVRSLIGQSSALVKAAEKAGSNQAVQKEMNNLIQQYLSGNTNPGIGTKSLGSGISYLRGEAGARVFFRMNDGVFEILGKASKANEQSVINTVLKIFGN